MRYMCIKSVGFLTPGNGNKMALNFLVSTLDHKRNTGYYYNTFERQLKLEMTTEDKRHVSKTSKNADSKLISKIDLCFKLTSPNNLGELPAVLGSGSRAIP